MGRQIFYRGILDFCNYSCAYCPFSKKKESERNLERDHMQLFRFIREIERQEFDGAVQIVPYGEALVHEYYWQGMAELSLCAGIQEVGAQSNFSFSVDKMLSIFRQYGGRKEKIRLWGTFHPDMTSVEEFLSQCELLQREGIQFCVGGVGVPENIGVLTELRRGLGENIYMWINKMDGCGCRYKEDEVQAFRKIDRFFDLELRDFHTDVRACREALLVQGDGTIRSCVLCHQKIGDLYRGGLGQIQRKLCTSGRCRCYLAYGSRNDIEELACFQPFPAFRIPADGSFL